MSTSFNVGVAAETKPSSRVLKPPGGGHSDIFGSSEVKQNAPRPKNNQQNSSNMNAVMGTLDPNESSDVGGKSAVANEAPAPVPAAGGGASSAADKQQAPAAADNQRARVPPGGHSAGFW
ncbi:jupiter microtubule associated homolog 1 [Anopheles aquasalis]|uniref:Microtubule-associated protein Jupiter n=1 Tax=Anopheles aquasalis TaxID=42839 RepID=T1E705_ANOAQ|nr:jupiter microtubule associated homolog 1 [Anopheles aquasalis]